MINREKVSTIDKKERTPKFMGLNKDIIRNFLDEWDSIETIEQKLNEEITKFNQWDMNKAKLALLEWLEYHKELPLNKTDGTYFENIEWFITQLKNSHFLHRILFSFNRKRSKWDINVINNFYNNLLEQMFKDQWEDILNKWLSTTLGAYIFLWIELKSWRKEPEYETQIIQIEVKLHYLLDKYLKQSSK